MVSGAFYILVNKEIQSGTNLSSFKKTIKVIANKFLFTSSLFKFFILGMVKVLAMY